MKDVAALGLGDGGVLLAKDGETHRVEAHPGGRPRRGVRRGAFRHRRRRRAGRGDGAGRRHGDARGPEGRLDRLLAVNASGAFAFAAGKRVFARSDKGKEKSLEVPSTARGLAFAPKGYRLAIATTTARRSGSPTSKRSPRCSVEGSHLDVTWSPDGRFVVTSMQENALHGWRLQPDRGHMRMSGYPSKTRSFRVVARRQVARHLGRRSGDRLVLRIQGPMGKAPRECGVRPARCNVLRSIPMPSCSRSVTRTDASSSFA